MVAHDHGAAAVVMARAQPAVFVLERADDTETDGFVAAVDGAGMPRRRADGVGRAAPRSTA